MSFFKTSVSFEKKYQEKKMNCKYIWQTEILFQIVIWYTNFELKIFKWRKKLAFFLLGIETWLHAYTSK